MNLRGFFDRLATDYERLDGLHTPTQRFLADAPSLLREHVAAGMLVKSAGGKGQATYTPMVGFFDPDETQSFQRGMYVVYILAEDRSSLALTLNQGMEHLRREHGDRDAQTLLAKEAAAIRAALPASMTTRFGDTIDLRSRGARQRAYLAGNIACRMYATAELPGEMILRDDLDAVMRMYQQAISSRRRLLLTAPGTITPPVASASDHTADPLDWFRPKDDSDYLTHVQAHTQRKTRRHERLVNDYAAWAVDQQFTTSTPHPQDLVLVKGGARTLVEVKVVYRGDTTSAVRAVVGQLTMYSHFLYGVGDQPRLLAVFSEKVGEAYVAFLASLGIFAVWWDEGHWRGSGEAIREGLAA